MGLLLIDNNKIWGDTEYGPIGLGTYLKVNKQKDFGLSAWFNLNKPKTLIETQEYNIVYDGAVRIYKNGINLGGFECSSWSSITIQSGPNPILINSRPVINTKIDLGEYVYINRGGLDMNYIHLRPRPVRFDEFEYLTRKNKYGEITNYELICSAPNMFPTHF